MVTRCQTSPVISELHQCLCALKYSSRRESNDEMKSEQIPMVIIIIHLCSSKEVQIA
jgi:hypothetical protein